MAENLKITHYADGTPIPLVTGDTEWGNLTNTDKAYCYYNDNFLGEAETYGALYSWAAAMNGATASSDNPSRVQGVCPDGWHLPSRLEWLELKTYINDDGGKLKETGTEHWVAPNTGADNSTGFTALPGGERHWSGFSHDIGYIGYWWTTDDSSGEAPYTTLKYNTTSIESSLTKRKDAGLSVRCVKN